MHDALPQESNLTPEQLAEITRRLVLAITPRALYLFGSHVSGTATPDSDIDIMVVLPGDITASWELRKRGYACLHGLGLPIELHFATETTFKRFGEVVGSLPREVQRKGRVLYAA